jgi:glycosyltransferase involved in cell wall biosynthesis
MNDIPNTPQNAGSHSGDAAVDSPFFSVAIPQYNRTSYLLKCLETIVQQSFKDFEICISDDCSPDGRQQEVIDYLERSGVRFQFRVNEKNLRYDGNLRSAISLTSGRYIFLMGNDDGLIDSEAFERTAAKLAAENFPAVLISNWIEENGTKSARVASSKNLGAGPNVAVQVWREYSFVSGVVFNGPGARALANSAWDGSEMYQMWLGARLVAQGGHYYTWSEALIQKDLTVPGETVDSYRTKRSVPWFTERLHTLHFLARLNYDGIAPSTDVGARPALAARLVRTLYSTTYPYWLFEYRQSQSWQFALAIALGMRPRHVTKALPLTPFAKLEMAVRWSVVTFAGLVTPVALFRWLQPMLYSYVKRARYAQFDSAAPAPSAAGIDVLVVGNAGGTNVGQSLVKVAQERGLTHYLMDQRQAYSNNRVWQSINWRLAGHRPANLTAFSNSVLAAVQTYRPKTLISTGISPINASTLSAIRNLGTRLINFSTDDPWNRTMRAKFFLDALKHYDAVFTPRTENVKDFENLGVPVQWLPFGYDTALFYPETLSPDIRQRMALPLLFVGGGDQDRADYLAPLAKANLGLNIYGSGFEDFSSVASCLRGRLEPVELRRRTIAAGVNICLVRHANRDQHVMRTLEIAACGGCLLAEDTIEHRDLFGVGAHYFNSPADLVVQARVLLNAPQEQQRIRIAVRAAVENRHRYQDRLTAMLDLGDAASD